MKKTKIYLDCDPGHDDAVALMLAGKSPKIELLGIGVSSGNQTLDKTGKNAFAIARYFNIDVPVCLGEDNPLKRSKMICAEIHGESGLDGVTFPDYDLKFSKFSSAEMMIKLSKECDDLTIVVTGPLTNLAKALIMDTGLSKRVKEFVIMGGSIGSGNVSPAAEFNILCDPEAADIVFNCGAVVKMMGLDVTRKVLVLPSVVERMNNIKNKAADFFVDLMKVFNANQKKVFGFSGGPLHDPVTIVYLINPKVVRLQEMNVVIDVTGGPSYGRTNCDQFDYLKQPHNAYVAVDIDVDEYWNTIAEGLENYSD